MTEEFIVEEPSRRPFLVAVAALTTIFILATICGLAFLLSGRSAAERAEEIAAIETQNAIIAVTNQAVTQTIAAMETEAALPTDTPEPTVTDTPLPEPDTPTATDTPVIDIGEGAATPEETSALDLTGTSAVVTPGVDETPTPIPGAGGIGTIDGGTPTGDDVTSLPQTGIDTWSAVFIALALIGTVFVARRLRSS